MRVIAFHGVAKWFRHTVALDDLHFEVRGARLTALLGPNGAGKTTAFRSTMGLYRTDGGDITVNGLKVGPDTAGSSNKSAGFGSPVRD